MASASAGLMRLRPVTFRYKNDPTGTLQSGLVVEEVERVYPELVINGPDGKVHSVRYLEFSALLPNELQKQSGALQQQANRHEKSLSNWRPRTGNLRRSSGRLKHSNKRTRVSML
jgi:hypothetical protein